MMNMSSTAKLNAATRLIAIEILTNARKLLTPVGHWTQDDFAFDVRGSLVAVDSPIAVCWCLLGAVEREAKPYGTRMSDTVTNYLGEICDERYSGVADFNDSPDTTHEDVLAFLDGAIELLETANE